MSKINLFFLTLIIVLAFSCNNNGEEKSTEEQGIDTLEIVERIDKTVDSIMLKSESIKPKIIHSGETEYKEKIVDRYFIDEKGQLIRIYKGGEGEGDFYIQDNKLIFIHSETEAGSEKYYFNNNKLFYQTEDYSTGKPVIVAYNDETEKGLLDSYNQYKKDIVKAKSADEVVEINFSGEYSWESENKKDGDAEAAFSLKLEQNGTSLTGGYSAYTGFGSKLDQGEDDYACKIEGKIDAGKAIINFTSCYSEETGMAELEFKNNKWVWTVKKYVTAWCPGNAILTKK